MRFGLRLKHYSGPGTIPDAQDDRCDAAIVVSVPWS